MTEQEIHSICKKYEIKDYTINMDGSIDVHNSVYLKGSPKRVFGQYFQCQSNMLTDLEHFPIVEDYTRSSVGMNPLQSISGYNGNINLLSCENKYKLVRRLKINNLLKKFDI